MKHGKQNLYKKWKKEIGEYLEKITKFILEEEKLLILFDNGHKLKVLMK